MTREADNPMTGSDFDWIYAMVSNHAVLGWKAPVKASVSGVSLLQLSPFFTETPDTQAKTKLIKFQVLTADEHVSFGPKQ